MNTWFRRDDAASDGLESDIFLSEALGALDPSSDDPNYWLRFRGWVMNNAGRELTRRRLLADLTIADVLTSWARTLVPTALLAAALAGIALVRTTTVVTEHPIGVEELLVSELPSEIVPVLLSPDEARGIVAFASDVY